MYMYIVIEYVNLIFEYGKKAQRELKCHAEATGQNETD